jgi:hypothetical protein
VGECTSCLEDTKLAAFLSVSCWKLFTKKETSVRRPGWNKKKRKKRSIF